MVGEKGENPSPAEKCVNQSKARTLALSVALLLEVAALGHLMQSALRSGTSLLHRRLARTVVATHSKCRQRLQTRPMASQEPTDDAGYTYRYVRILNSGSW